MRNTTKRNFQATSRMNNFGNCGRRPKLSNPDVSYIFRLVRKNCSKKGKIEKIVLANKGIESYSALKKPLLTVSDRTKRYKLCKERRNWTDKEWAKVIFSDESNFKFVLPPESLSTPTSNQGRDWYYEPNRIENQSKGAALQDLNELDPSRMRFGIEFRIMDWPLKKIQEEKVESRKRLAHRLDSDEDVPP
ncbi:transposable element tcb1 transposase [Brachionus plicatilis]|uniref:Transposable element tcb1 transposase n=1 Tax=Brachionus plicatilis TaxID=10195 RepID=A0A3M7R2K8_BRAPC|nr:transposable element tcb1 transposase [Brachionus plicatilis]